MADETDPTRAVADVARAYRRVFLTPDGNRVLSDLARTFHPRGDPWASPIVAGDPQATAVNCGRRDVLNHIQKSLMIEEKSLND